MHRNAAAAAAAAAEHSMFGAAPFTFEAFNNDNDIAFSLGILDC